jgi:hypothetical protein
MHTPSVQQQLITARIDDIRRARHNQPVGDARPIRTSAGSRGDRDYISRPRRWRRPLFAR